MNNTNLRLISLVSAELFGKKIDLSLFENINQEDWKKVLEISNPHNVQSFAIDAIIHYLPDNLKPPKMVYTTWMLMLEDIEKRYEKRCRVIEKLALLFAEEDMKMMLIKGVGLASYYPIPEHRRFTDVDFYVFGDYLKADRIVAKSIGLDVSNDYPYHTTFYVDGVLVENHFDFINAQSHSSNVSFEKQLKKMAETPSKKELIIGKAKVLLPSADFNAIYLMRHMSSHFAAEESCLRNVCDWGIFLKNEHANIDFQFVYDMFKKYNMNRFADAVGTILVDYMGMDPSIMGLYFKREKELSLRVLSEILEPEIPPYTSQYQSNPIKSIAFRTHRFFANKWKHDLTYSDNFYYTFIKSSISHLKKPKLLIK